MQRIKPRAQKKILVEMLDYFHKLCQKNNIKYSLIGGSLIGAVRHKGFIPWDDDIDVILMPDEFKKLIRVLKNEENSKYILFYNQVDYYYPFLKLVNIETTLVEKNLKKIDNYGLFIDIFKYHYISNNKLRQKIHFKLLKCKKTLINGYFYKTVDKSKKKYYLRKIREKLSQKLGIKNILSIYKKECNKVKKKTNYVMSDWPSYAERKEIQLSTNLENYIIAEFEGIEVMISENYDNILRTTFGNYMQLPPIQERTGHKLSVYYRA